MIKTTEYGKGGGEMAQCVKCGRQIPEGELFCAECSLNPGAAEMQPRETVQIPGGRMQTPV